MIDACRRPQEIGYEDGERTENAGLDTFAGIAAPASPFSKPPAVLLKPSSPGAMGDVTTV